MVRSRRSVGATISPLDPGPFGVEPSVGPVLDDELKLSDVILLSCVLADVVELFCVVLVAVELALVLTGAVVFASVVLVELCEVLVLVSGLSVDTLDGSSVSDPDPSTASVVVVEFSGAAHVVPNTANAEMRVVVT